jgi:hypothetical protein
MEILSLLPGLAFLNVVYDGEQLVRAFCWGIQHTHYFPGIGPRHLTI